MVEVFDTNHFIVIVSLGDNATLSCVLLSVVYSFLLLEHVNLFF